MHGCEILESQRGYTWPSVFFHGAMASAVLRGVEAVRYERQCPMLWLAPFLVSCQRQRATDTRQILAASRANHEGRIQASSAGANQMPAGQVVGLGGLGAARSMVQDL